MKQHAIAELLCQEQSGDGGFRSFLHWGDASLDDWNCFTTGLVLRHLHGNAPSAVREKGLDFLLRCCRPDGTFGFWPLNRQPSWIRDTVGSDCDDSAIAALELTRAGRWDQRRLRQLVFETLLRNRLPAFDQPAPPWLQPGVFLTWLGTNNRNCTVDCCANANVVALLAFGEMTHVPGYREACQMIEAGIRWAGDDRVRARSLTPYYAEPAELRYAVEHAVHCGSSALEESDRLIQRTSWAQVSPNLDSPVCSSAYGGVFWTSPVLQTVRQHELSNQHA